MDILEEKLAQLPAECFGCCTRCSKKSHIEITRPEILINSEGMENKVASTGARGTIDNDPAF